MSSALTAATTTAKTGPAKQLATSKTTKEFYTCFFFILEINSSITAVRAAERDSRECVKKDSRP